MRNLRQLFLETMFRKAGYRWTRTAFGGISTHGSLPDRGTTMGLAELAADRALAEVLAAAQIDLVIDVGANAGQFARRVRRCGYRGRIVSYEPSTSPLPELTETARLDGQITVRPVGVAAEAGAIPFIIYSDSHFNSAHRRAPEIGDVFASYMQVKEQTTIPTVRLDDELAQFGDAKRIFLKSDTQGFDLEVLKGSEKLMARVQGIHLELPLVALYENAPTAGIILPFLADRGFSLSWIVPISNKDDQLSSPVIECDGIFVRS